MRAGRALVLAVPVGVAGAVPARTLRDRAGDRAVRAASTPCRRSAWRILGSDSLALIATDPLYRAALLLSLKVAGLSTLVCLLAGYPMALAIARSGERWRSLLLLLVMLPFWTGFLMRINAWIGLLQDDGWINTVVVALGLAPLHLLYTDAAMYVGIVYTYLPFMVLPLYARLSQLDPAIAGGGGRSRRPAVARFPAR